MRKLFPSAVIATTMLALALLPLAQVHAQATAKPVAIVSIADVGKLKGDINYLAEAAGQQGLAMFGMMAAEQYLQLLDPTKPIGVLVNFNFDGPIPMPAGVAFLPIKDFDKAITMIEQAMAVEAQDLGNGVRQIDGFPPVFLKKSGDWAFASTDPFSLGNLPDDPAALLNGLNEEYDIAISVLMQNIPDDAKQMAMMQIRQGIDAGLGAAGDSPDAELAKQLSDNSFDQLEMFLTETESMTIGWNIDPQGQNTYFDFSVTALEGTAFAETMALYGESKSDFSGFLVPEAAVTMNVSTPIPSDQTEQLKVSMDQLRQQVLSELENDRALDDPEIKELVDSLVGKLFDTFTAMMEAGKIDAGASLVLQPNLMLTAGAFVADGKALDDVLREIIILASQEPGAPQVNLDAEEHAGVIFHTLSIDAREIDSQAERILGNETLDVAVGTGKETIYLAVGKDALSALKEAIDASAAGSPENLPLFQTTVTLGAILEFAQTVDESGAMAMMAPLFEQVSGNDRISMTETAIERGILMRVEVEAGVLKLIGGVAGAVGGPPAF